MHNYKEITCDETKKMTLNSQIDKLNIGVAPITQVTQVRNKNSNIQGRSLYVIKVIFHTTLTQNGNFT